jgi:hypothetical protein
MSIDETYERDGNRAMNSFTHRSETLYRSLPYELGQLDQCLRSQKNEVTTNHLLNKEILTHD